MITIRIPKIHNMVTRMFTNRCYTHILFQCHQTNSLLIGKGKKGMLTRQKIDVLKHHITPSINTCEDLLKGIQYHNDILTCIDFFPGS